MKTVFLLGSFAVCLILHSVCATSTGPRDMNGEDISLDADSKTCLKPSDRLIFSDGADNKTCQPSDSVIYSDNRRLYGSLPTTDAEEPDYFVFLDFKFDHLPNSDYMVKRYHQYCGGTLIQPLWVITAAICMCQPGDVKPTNVRNGSLATVGKQKEIENMHAFPMKVAVVHPEYDDMRNRANLGLVQLDDRALDITKTLTLAKLGLDFDPGEGVEVTMYGFGATSYNSIALMTSLRIVRMRTQRHEFCAEAAYYCEIYSQINNFCVFNKEIMGPAHDDVGGGAFINGTLVGVISWGTEGTGSVLENVASGSRFGWVNFVVNGFGLYNYCIALLSAVLVIAMVFASYTMIITIPASACELETTLEQQSLISMSPFIGTFVTPVWGFLADTKGRRKILLVSMVTGSVLCALSAFSPNWIALMIMNMLTAASVCGTYAISFSLLSENTPMAHRNPMMILVTSVFLLSQGLMAVTAIPVIPLSFANYIGFLDIYFNSWRLLIIIYALPCAACALILVWTYESPKFLLSQGDEEGALRVLRGIYAINNRRKTSEYEVMSLFLGENVKKEEAVSFWSTVKTQTVPLFKPPLLKNFLLFTGMLVIVFSSANSIMVWLPTIANNFLNTIGEGESDGMTMCQVLQHEGSSITDPDANPCALNNMALLFVFAVGAVQSLVNGITSLFVDRVGRRNIVICLHVVSGISGICINFVTNSIGSLVMFFFFVITVLSTGLLTAIAVGMFPTHLRAMALSLAMLAGRVSTTISTTVLNIMLSTICEETFYIYGTIAACGALLSFFLPRDGRHEKLK